MLLQQLFEMPRLINDVDFNLGNIKANLKFAKDSLNDPSKIIIHQFNEDLVLIRIKKQLLLINTLHFRVMYYMKWSEFQNNYLDNILMASQIAVWRSNKLMDPIKDTAELVFFEGLLTEYDAVITDVLQTKDGQRFWIKRISDALDKKLYVYYVNFLKVNNETNRELIKITSQNHFDRLSDEKNFWGEEQKYASRRIIISKILLKNNK